MKRFIDSDLRALIAMVLVSIILCVLAGSLIHVVFITEDPKNPNKNAVIKFPTHIIIEVSKSEYYPGLEKICAYENELYKKLLWCNDGVKNFTVNDLVKTEFMDLNGDLYDRVTVIFKKEKEE